MQDVETDSYWSLMKSAAIAGSELGTKMQELPYGKKMRWRDWIAQHPETLVLSVDGREDGRDGYKGYFLSPEGYRGLFANDKRMRTKEPVFAFHYKGRAYAIAQKKLKNGAMFDVGEASLFLYRAPKSKMFESTVAFIAENDEFVRRDGKWRTASGLVFNPESKTFEKNDKSELRVFTGFDTFWYNWSLNNPQTEVLK